MNTIRFFLLFFLMTSLLIASQLTRKTPKQDVLHEKDESFLEEKKLERSESYMSFYIFPGSQITNSSPTEIVFVTDKSMEEVMTWYTTLSQQLDIASAERQRGTQEVMITHTYADSSSILVKLHQKDSSDTVSGVITVKNP